MSDIAIFLRWDQSALIFLISLAGSSNTWNLSHFAQLRSKTCNSSEAVVGWTTNGRTMTTDISVGVRWDPIHNQEVIEDYEFDYDGGNSSSRLFERSRIKALAGESIFRIGRRWLNPEYFHMIIDLETGFLLVYFMLRRVMIFFINLIFTALGILIRVAFSNASLEIR